ncbi:tRNA (adenine(58)-N(1))-methyltransferase non-catalytic subunit TRM6 [Carassius carassius]|uniref:tRNA (adenine(58)-N(1))-methyltransferase non-catalytic subunit TRM6 n=1 Tax=Carassius carassius TaxID=217509 RepID=UPI0028694CB6|nr:tRNA (adenine(58)-N(1))-methyltransferase non-catalytic subunit TRM6 [Carassius carassius]XP_059368167.1 tRNA (adenine(58)-N(1))-methyltransferase non-catalytic subunit TRM6 [Carassius carassius]
MAECVKDSDAEGRISYGDYVVLKRGDIFKSVQIENKKKVIFEKQWFFLDNAVGQLYGAVFEIEAGGSLKLKAAKHSGDSLDSKEAGQDNRHIMDDGRSQKLSRDDIETLKEQGLKGQEIVQQLIDNSTTFKDKTEFAQEKYIKKKKKKYESNIKILKPSTRLLAMMYHGREPGKICHLRYDTLAQILTLGNIHAGSKILVFETCAGLVLGSVMERMGGYGSVIQMYPGGGPTRAGMESFGFPSHFHKTLHEFPLCKVNALLAGTLDLSEKDGDGNGRSESSQKTSGVSEKSSEPQSMEVSVDPQEEMRRAERERLREQRAQEKKLKMEEKRKKLASAAALLEGRNADGLVIASRFHPCPVLMGLLKFVAPSRPFIVYCQYREPLIECYTKLREQGGAISLRLTDSWLRHYQVLPNRTHPVLLMSGGGGYLLSGTTVAAKARNQHKAEEPVTKRLKLDKISSSCDSSA